MTKDDAEKLLPLIKAYSEEKKIQFLMVLKRRNNY